MSCLSARSRDLLVLREIEGLSYRELAAVLGIPAGTVMSSLSRARRAFRRALDSQLEQRGIPHRSPSHEREAGAWMGPTARSQTKLERRPMMAKSAQPVPGQARCDDRRSRRAAMQP